MTTVYVSWATGDDTTGDGSFGNPWKTITKGTTGLTGGDEVRVAKSPAPTALTGTLTFTAGSTAVTGSGTAFSSELVIGDFIEGGDGYWYEVVTIDSNTSATLGYKYSSATQAGVSSRKLGVTSTGAAAAADAIVQEVSASGTSAVSRLKISGGWDLSTQTQDGQTFFRQMHGTFGNRWGWGLYAFEKNYVEIERLHCLRYGLGLYVRVSGNFSIAAPACLGCATAGIYFSTGSTCTLTSPVCMGSNSGIWFAGGSYNTVTSPVCNSNVTSGIYGNVTYYNTFASAVCKYNTTNGINLIGGSRFNTLTSPVCSNNINSGIAFADSYSNTVTGATCEANGDHGVLYSGSHSNTLTSPVCSSNSKFGIYYATSNGNRASSPTCESNVSGGIYNSGNNSILGTLTTTGNGVSAVSAVSGNLTVTKASIAESARAAGFTTYANARLLINDIGGQSEIWTDGGNIVSQNATAGGTGKEWRFNVTSATRDATYSLTMEVARVACAANAQVTITLYFKKSGTGIAGSLFVRGGQIAGVDTDVSTTCPNNTTRNNVQIQFTPTEAGVISIEAAAWYLSATSQNVIIDDIAIAQA